MLPFFKSTVSEFERMQTRWMSELNPALSNPLLKGRQIDSVALQTGDNTVDHMLGRQPIGWFIVDLNANEGVYKVSWSPTSLVLNSSGPVTVSLYVY